MNIELCEQIEAFFAPNPPEALGGMWYHYNPNGIPENSYCIMPKVEPGKTIWEPVCRAYTINDIIPLLKVAKG